MASMISYITDLFDRLAKGMMLGRHCLISSRGRRVTGDIGSGNNDYHFKTFSGDVRIR